MKVWLIEDYANIPENVANDKNYNNDTSIKRLMDELWFDTAQQITTKTTRDNTREAIDKITDNE